MTSQTSALDAHKSKGVELMRHTHLLSKLSLAIALFATASICQASFTAPIGPIVIAEETPASAATEILPVLPMETNVIDIFAAGETPMATPTSSQQSDFFAMAWTWMQMYPAWAGFFCTAILMSLVHFGQTIWGVEEMEATEEHADHFVEEKATFAQVMPEVVIPQEEVQEHTYEISYNSASETEVEIEEPTPLHHS